MLERIVLAASRWTPWPHVLLIRHAFRKGGEAAARGLEKHLPSGIVAHRDLRYDPRDRDARLDVYLPPGRPGDAGDPHGDDVAGARLLTPVVWIHGGGWVAGDKDEIGNYARVLADRGFAVAAVNYSLAPGRRYPTPARQVNAALGWLAANAARFGFDPGRFVLAGDSAGAQIAVQVAWTVCDPAYAAALGIVPAIRREQLRGALLHCGVYEVTQADLDGPAGDFLRTVLWAFFGRRDFRAHPLFPTFPVLDHVGAGFPPTFITVGNGDPLDPQARRLAGVLAAHGVEVDPLFFATDRQPGLPHEYQFDLDTEAGREALERSVEFLLKQQ